MKAPVAAVWVCVSFLVGLYPSLATAGHAEFVVTEIAPNLLPALPDFTATLDFDGLSVNVSDVFTHQAECKTIAPFTCDPGTQVIMGSGLNCFSFAFGTVSNGEPCKAPPLVSAGDLPSLIVNVSIVGKQATGNNLIGSVVLHDIQNDLLLNFDPQTDLWNGELHSDETTCNALVGCTFEGIWTAVPEPSSLPIFMAALGLYVAMVNVCRRRGNRVVRRTARCPSRVPR